MRRSDVYKFEWLVHRTLLFTLRAHATLRRIHRLPTSVGLAQARPNNLITLHSFSAMTTTNSGISVTVLLSVLCLGLAMMFVGVWYFYSSLVELEAQQQETAQIVQQLKEKVRKQSKQLNELRLQLEMSQQFKVSISFSSSYNRNCTDCIQL